MRRRQSSCGQSFLEYTILIGIVVTVLLMMNTYMKRGIQAMIKATADQVGNQAQAEQTLNQMTKGYLAKSSASTTAFVNKRTSDVDGLVTYNAQEGAQTSAETLSNLEETERE